MRRGTLQWGLWYILLLPRSLLYYASGFDATPRWGQATVVVNGALFIFGGKTDEFNSYSYTSAPNTNDVLYLSLSSNFSGASAPWELVSSSANTSTSQGPALAWHTLSAFNNSGVLLFGGQPGPNSPTVIVDVADSAALLDVYSRLSPTWTIEPPSWGGEPIRRIRHSTATSPSGLVFIFGGEKADGSQNAFSDHFYFDPNTESFTLLPSTNAPPDLYGHVSIILPDGRILVFGGYCQSQGTLLPFSTIWVLDTSTLEWTVVRIDEVSLPSPRMAFAAVFIPGGKIIIHGGSDANLQINFSDGWELDTTTNPMTWTPIDGLSQLGPRRDHFAVCSGDEVIFGFGYQNSGPAPALLQVFDHSSGSFVPAYTAPPPAVTPTQTLPQPTRTSNPSTPTSEPHSTTLGIHPTVSNGPGSSGSPDNGSPDDDDDGSRKNTTAIAVGTAFGVLGLIGVGLGAAYYVRRQHRAREGNRQFMALGGGDDDDDDEVDSPHFEGRIPVASMQEGDPQHHGHHGILSSLGITGALGVATKLIPIRNTQQRRDMLADEDTRSFGEWYDSRRRDGTGGSSWSLRSILGAGVRLRSREASATSHGTGNVPASWREKADPFSDGASLMRDEETGFIGAAAVGSSTRPHARREVSYASSRSGLSYHDPFADPIQEGRRADFEANDLYTDHYHSEEENTHDPVRPTIRAVPPLTPLRTALPLSQQPHLLSPLSEHTSQSTLPLQTFSTSGSSPAHSSEHVISPFAGSSLSGASLTTAEPPPPPQSPRTSIIGASGSALLNTNQPMRRSDSWWARFSRTSLLDRRSSGSRLGYEIRDPNPPPKLVAIEERSMVPSPTRNGTGSPGSAEQGKQLQKASPQQQAALARANSAMMFGTGHGKSMSSVRTADSEAIERMAGTMDVVQRMKIRRGTGSTSSMGGLSVDTHASSVEGSLAEPKDNLAFFASPVEDICPSTTDPLSAPAEPVPLARLASPPLPATPKAGRNSTSPSHGRDNSSTMGGPSSSKVAARMQAYERKMSQDHTSPPPTNTKHKEERTKKRVEMDYELVPRPSLFVANPDRRLSSTESS